MKCPKCGKEIANDSVFCEFCGTRARKDKQHIKRVDIRWCLLPAMIIATIAMGFAAESWDIRLYHGVDHNVEPFFVIPLCLFVVSCWCGIKKIVPSSFVILIVILFSINCKILYDSMNTRNVYKHAVTVSWSNDDDGYKDGHGGITLESFYDYYIENDHKIKGELGKCASALEKRLKDEGKENIEISCIYTEYVHYTGWKGYEAFFYISIFLLIYLVYAYIAQKRGWKF